MHRKTTENAVFTRNFEFVDPLRSFDRNMVFNYTNLTIRKGLYHTACTLLHHMKCFNIHDAVYSHNTNERPAIDDKIVLSGLNNILDFFEIEK